MRFFFLSLLTLTMLSTAEAQYGSAAEFANFKRYAKANAEIVGSNIKTVLLGNSITDAWASQDPDFFKENDLVGRGISGQTSTQLLLRFRADVIQLKPQNVVIHIGTNDIAENTGPYSEDQTFDNIASMVDIATAHGIRVYIAAIVPSTKFSWREELGNRSDMIVSLNKRLMEYAHSHQLGFIDYHAALRNDDNGMNVDIAADGVHPTTKGYKIMGRTLLMALK